MAEPNLIATTVEVGRSFKEAATRVQPVLTIHVRPDAVETIISKLDRLQDRTDDSKIVKSGGKFSFVDTRNNQLLAELDSTNGRMTLYKSPDEMAKRIDSAFISAKTINDFIAASKVPENALLATAASSIKMASR